MRVSRPEYVLHLHFTARCPLPDAAPALPTRCAGCHGRGGPPFFCGKSTPADGPPRASPRRVEIRRSVTPNDIAIPESDPFDADLDSSAKNNCHAVDRMRDRPAWPGAITFVSTRMEDDDARYRNGQAGQYGNGHEACPWLRPGLAAHRRGRHHWADRLAFGGYAIRRTQARVVDKNRSPVYPQHRAALHRKRRR